MFRYFSATLLLLSASLNHFAWVRPLLSVLCCLDFSSFLFLFRLVFFLLSWFLRVCEFHRDATRHSLGFMFFIIISFVNFCIAFIPLTLTLCASSLFSYPFVWSVFAPLWWLLFAHSFRLNFYFSNVSLVISLIYITWMRRSRTRTPFIEKYNANAIFVLLVTTGKVFDLISCLDCFVALLCFASTFFFSSSPSFPSFRCCEFFYMRFVFLNNAISMIR